MSIRAFFTSLLLVSASMVLYGFYAERTEKMEELSHYGDRINRISKVGAANPEFEAGSGLNGIYQVGFFCLSEPPTFGGDKTRQINFLLWMKERLKKAGHVIILDLEKGIDFTGVAKGCWASLDTHSICMKNFKKKTETYIQELERLELELTTSIRVQETNKTCSWYPIWRQEMFIDASDKDNLEIGYKNLVENLIDDLTASNVGYKKTPVFYLYIDTDLYPHLKKAFGKHEISPPLTTIPDTEKNSDNN